MNAQANFPSDLDIFPSSHSASDTSNGLIETEDIEGFGIAGRTWEASYLILPYLLPPTPSSQFDYSPPPPTHDLHSPSSSTILEIGSGTGFLSLSLASYLIRGTTSTSKMIMTDLTEVCPLLLRNLHHSILSPSSQILIRPLPWGSSQAIQELEREGLKPTFIIASDLVYFPFLFPSLLRTLISLTEGKDRVGVVFGYKIRSLVKEEPFWKALGNWFEMERVLRRKVPTMEDPDPLWDEYGGEGLGIFLCHRRLSSIGRLVSMEDDKLMEESSDDQFELQLLSSISVNSE